MSTSTNEYQAALAEVDFAALQRVAAAERAEAVKSVGRAIAHWLRSGLRLRYSDDALTHPAAGAPCGC